MVQAYQGTAITAPPARTPGSAFQIARERPAATSTATIAAVENSMPVYFVAAASPNIAPASSSDPSAGVRPSAASSPISVPPSTKASTQVSTKAAVPA